MPLNATISMELVGLAAGALNIVSTFPILFQSWKHARKAPRDLAHIRSRLIQLSANLTWCFYAVQLDLPSIYITAGFMSACLFLVIANLAVRRTLD